MPYAYSNNGLSMRAVLGSYTPVDGEVLFPDGVGLPTSDQLTSAFDGYAAAIKMASAKQDFADKIAGGIAITSEGSPSINATYSLDQETLDEIKGVANDVAPGLGLPADWDGYPDIHGVMKPLDGPNVVNLYKAMRDLVSLMSRQMATQAGGGDPVWPPQTATID